MKNLLLLLLLISTSAIADYSVPVTHDGTREDGSKFDLSDLSEVRIYCGTTAGDYQVDVPTVLTLSEDDSGMTVTVIEAPVGQFCVVTAVDKQKRESLYSNEFILDKANPSPFYITPGLVLKPFKNI